MYWSQTESSKCSLESMSNHLAHPFMRAAIANHRFDRTRSWATRWNWAAVVTGHALVARGCELCRTQGKAFSTARGLMWRRVEWHAIGALHPTHAALTVHLCAAKDGAGKEPRYPMQIRRRTRGNATARDALCALTTCYSPHGTRTHACSATPRHSTHPSSAAPPEAGQPRHYEPAMCDASYAVSRRRQARTPPTSEHTRFASRRGVGLPRLV